MGATRTNSNMNFLIADDIQSVSGTMITFSQGGAAKIKSKQFSEFGSRTKELYSILSTESQFSEFGSRTKELDSILSTESQLVSTVHVTYELI